jgi:hypothetical protein
MGEWDKCIEVAGDLLGSDPSSRLDDITTYFANTRTSQETLWCIVKTELDKDYSPRSELASLYYSPDSIGGIGWCEIYWSDPMIELMFRHPEDKRLSYYGNIGATNDGKKMVHWPVYDEKNRFRLNANVMNVDFDMDAAENEISYEGKKYTVKRVLQNGYPVYYINGFYANDKDDDGFDLGTRVYVRDNVNTSTGVRQTFPAYTMSKFSYQNGNPMLASPAVIRMGEIVLNMAEAYAHKGDVANALKYVNVIRTRAGIPTWKDEAAFKAAGYTDILDVVLDERRLELCFEGHRAFDLYRNSKAIDRRFAGNQPWEVIEATDMSDQNGLDFRFPYCIPFEETSVSGIPGNGKNF